MILFFFFLLFISTSFSQIIQHDPIESSLSNQAINFNIFVDDNGREIDRVSLMYKNMDQIEYLNKEMINKQACDLILEIHKYHILPYICQLV